MIINALTARYLGPSNFGLINYAASLVAFVTPLMQLGLSDVLVYEIIKNPDNEGTIIGTSIAMSFVSALCCIIGLGTIMHLVNPSDQVATVVVILYSLLLLSQSMELIQYWFHAKLLSKYVSIVSFFAYIVISGYKFFLLVSEKSVYWFAISNSLDYLLIALILLVIYRRISGQRLGVLKSTAISLWNQGKHYILPGLMGVVLAQSDRVMIRAICGDDEVGFYSAALYIATLSSFVFTAIISSYRPVILEKKREGTKEYEHHLTKLYGIVLYTSLAQAIALALLSSTAVHLLYGEAYAPAIPIVRVVIWYTCFSYLGAVKNVWILAENKQSYLWIISFTGMILNILLNLALIPRFGSMGAAVATLITQIFTNIILECLLKPLRGHIHYVVQGIKLTWFFR